MQQCLIRRIRAGALIFENFHSHLWKSPLKSFFSEIAKISSRNVVTIIERIDCMSHERLGHSWDSDGTVWDKKSPTNFSLLMSRVKHQRSKAC